MQREGSIIFLILGAIPAFQGGWTIEGPPELSESQGSYRSQIQVDKQQILSFMLTTTGRQQALLVVAPGCEAGGEAWRVWRGGATASQV